MKTPIQTLATLAFIAAIIFFIVVSNARADGINTAIEDPEITAPLYVPALTCPEVKAQLRANPFLWFDNEWRTLERILCDDDSRERPRKDPPPASDPDPDPEDPEDPKDDPEGPKDKTKKPKDNASEHNGKGGNDGKGGKNRDGSKNSDKGRKKNG